MAWEWAFTALPALVLLFSALVLWTRAPSKPVPIRGRHVLITGGSSGIGLEIAKLAAVQGARKISLVARNMDRLNEAKQQVEDHAKHSSITEVNVEVISVDVVNYANVKQALQQAGVVDVLICCHGVSISCLFEDTPIQDLHMMLDINVKGTENVIHAALPEMKKNSDGTARSIVLFSSQAGQAGLYGYGGYAPTKFALRGLAECLKQELFIHNIQISVVYPPDTNTPGFIEENKSKPKITKMLSESSGAMEAYQVAKVSMEGITAAKFNISCNFDGHMLSIACVGMSPQTSSLYSALELISLPFIRTIALFVVSNWFRTIRLNSRV